MILAYFAAIISGTLYGLTESINKNITEEKYSSFSYFFLQIFLNFLIFLPIFLLFGSIPRDLNVYLYVVIPVTCTFFGNLFLIKAYKTEDISNINILSRSSLIITFLSGIFLLSETITIEKILGVAAIVFGILVIFYEGKRLKVSFALLLALLSGILTGLNAYFDKKALAFFNPISFIFFANLFLTILLFSIPQSYRDIKKIFTKYKKKIIISRFTSVLAFYLIIWAFQKGAISIANTNFETAFLLSGVIIGIIFLGEKKNIAKKLAGSALCTLGIILLNFF